MFMYVFEACLRCEAVFGFHPDHVPSIRDKAGIRRPICKDCLVTINRQRVELGRPAFPPPHPDAYEPKHVDD